MSRDTLREFASGHLLKRSDLFLDVEWHEVLSG